MGAPMDGRPHPSLSEIDGQAPCYPASLQAGTIHERHRDEVNRGRPEILRPQLATTCWQGRPAARRYSVSSEGRGAIRSFQQSELFASRRAAASLLTNLRPPRQSFTIEVAHDLVAGIDRPP